MSQTLSARLASCRALPSLPGVALRILEIAQDPATEMNDAARVLALDPALATKVLRIANSPLYATRRRSENLRQAASLLGLNALLTLALSFSLTRALRGGPGPDLDPVWRRSLLAATACKAIGGELGLRASEELFLAGLLAGIGRLALARLDPDAWAEIPPALDGEALLQAEMARFDGHHLQAGLWLVEHWRLPAYIADAIRAAESTTLGAPAPAALDEASPADGRFAAVVGLGLRLARLWDDFAAPPDQAALATVAAHAEASLGLDAARVLAVVERIAGALPEIASLFDLRVGQAERTESLLEHARELLMVRNLLELQEAQRHQGEAQRLQDHTRTLEEQASRDALTGAHNRGHFNAALAREFDAATTFGWPLSLALLDLDHFKSVNDRFGHLAGDEALRAFTRLVQQGLRSGDVFARFGGEEFVLLLPGTRAEGARAVLQRVLAALRNGPVAVVDGAALHITTSIGLAVLDGRSRHASPEAMIGAADRALYQAKRDGRDRLAEDAPG